ncbi:hypothetical protein [Pseudomonas sp. RIT411]|uniref:hypothetical protein n=1 Tax=Pseudomonas sp. RIT411 TaxID=2202160 RepID=UPI0011BDE004|nr:hypothetical protein [Pseudomonas sp. RIT 411]
MAKLDQLTSSISTQVVISAIREITNDTSFASFVGVVSAEVGGVQKIYRQKIDVQLTYNRPNHAIINILWEDCGYKNYKSMGLYGMMTTEWNEVVSTSARSFKILGGTFEIEVCY